MLLLVRFTNIIASGLTTFSSKQIWTKLRRIRANYLSSNLSSMAKGDCNVSITEDHIYKNLEIMLDYLKLSNTSSEPLLNLEKETIDESAKMFMYLHACPHGFQYWDDFASSYFIGDITKLILLTFKIITKSLSLDGKIILSKFVSKSATKLGFQFLSVEEDGPSNLGYTLIKDTLRVKGEVPTT